tara:strand:+ start:701 stop:907 length:207 start_codon:yes stop_codon:yes gene_type:complete
MHPYGKYFVTHPKFLKINFYKLKFKKGGEKIYYYFFNGGDNENKSPRPRNQNSPWDEYFLLRNIQNLD